MGLWALEFDYREIMTIGVRKWMEDEWMTVGVLLKYISGGLWIIIDAWALTNQYQITKILSRI